MQRYLTLVPYKKELNVYNRDEKNLALGAYDSYMFSKDIFSLKDIKYDELCIAIFH